MNQPIRRVALFCFLLIVALLVSSNYIQVVNADSYKARSKNQRIILDQYAYPRGTITTADGTVIAKSVLSGGLNYKYQRQYPLGPAYANITGYKSLVFGATDVERQLDQFLSGNSSNLAVSNFMDTITGKPKQGGNVQLTLDNKVQQTAIDALGQGKTVGSVVALDPATGAILAMYSNPTFDPNPVSANESNVSTPAGNALDKDPAKPGLNHAIGELYPPGSIFKIITTAAALDAGGGKFNETDQTDAPAKFYTYPGTSKGLQNEKNETCGDTSLKTALAQSCNSVYGWLGNQLGSATMANTAAKFGLNSTTFTGLTANGGTTPLKVVQSVFPTNIGSDAATLAQASIGQNNTSVTPLQAAMIAAAVANDGKLMTPYLVQRETSSRGSEVYKASPTVLEQAMTQPTAAALQDMMVNVVQQGTGGNAKIDGVTVGGKTGTAEQGGTKNPLAWFVSYATANGKSVAVAVLVQDNDAKGRGDISGGGLAAPVAKEVMKAALGIQ